MSVRITAMLLVVGLSGAGCSGGSSGSSAAGNLLGGRTVDAAGLRFDIPERWQEAVPRSPMRKAEVAIPGDGGAAELAVFHFGAGQGGKVEANLARWVAQIEMPAGEEARRDFFESNGFAITLLTAAGTLKPGRMGMGPKEARPGSWLIGAVVEGPGGPWFLKATGPAATLAPQREAFVAMLKSARAAGS